MKFLGFVDSARSARTVVVGAGLSGALCLSLTVAAQAAGPAAPPTEAQLRAAWSQSISHTPPPTEGCFSAEYPRTTWTQVACTTPPDRRYEPAHGASGYTVGNGNDYAAAVSGLISSSVGSFPTVKGVKAEKDGTVANEYSLQLNTQFFSSSPACKNAKVPASCLAWQQFVFAEQGGTDSGGVLFMQYWLIDYVNACPSGWMKYSTDCYRNSSGVSVPAQTIKQLKYLTVSGTTVAGGVDTIALTTNGNAYSTTGKDSVVDLANFWHGAEFNVVGDGDGSEATFNAGPTIDVQITVEDGTTTAPTCKADAGTTGETNNLTLGKCKATGGATPAIKFSESN
jgi:hypothetical protein